MAYIDYSFIGVNATLRLDCHIAEGWEKHKKTYSFSKEIKFDWRFGYAIRAHVDVFPSPATLQRAWAEFTPDTTKSGQYQGVTFNLNNDRLILDLNLLGADSAFNNELSWDRTTNDKLCIKWENFVFPYRLRILIVFNPPASGPPSIERDWSGFSSGGLPSLGKKR